MDPMLKNLIRVGSVSAINPEKCTARVVFADRSEVVSFELPVLVRGSLRNKDYWMPDPGEQVVCLFLPSGNAQGFIIGSIYSERDKPPVTEGNKRHMLFSDGTVIEYDSSTSKLLIDAKGSVEIDARGNVTINTADTISITAPKGITLSATDITGTGVVIVGKGASQGW